MYVYTHTHVLLTTYVNHYLISYLKPWPSNFNDTQILVSDPKAVKFNNMYK